MSGTGRWLLTAAAGVAAAVAVHHAVKWLLHGRPDAGAAAGAETDASSTAGVGNGSTACVGGDVENVASPEGGAQGEAVTSPSSEASGAAAAVNRRPGWTEAHVCRLRAMESFLRRLSQSPHRYKVLLSGSALTHVYIPASPRLQSDIDLMAVYENDIRSGTGSVTERLVRDVCQAPAGAADGVAFDPTGVSWSTTWEETGRPGARYCLPYTLDADAETKHTLTLDVAFDEPIFPGPTTVEYPSAFGLPGFPLSAVRPELLVAWKLHGLWEKEPTKGYSAGSTQGYWRPKDLCDLHLFATRGMGLLDADLLGKAVHTAFKDRRTPVENIVKLAEKTFGSSTNSHRNWMRFRRKLLASLLLDKETGAASEGGEQALVPWPPGLAPVPASLDEVKEGVAVLAKRVLLSLGYRHPSVLGDAALFRPSLLDEVEARIADSRGRLVERQDSGEGGAGADAGGQDHALAKQPTTSLTPELFFMTCGRGRSESTFELIRRCLAEWDDQLKMSTYRPPAALLRPEGLDDGSVSPREAVESLTRHCCAAIRQSCVVSAAFFEPDSEPGRAVALDFSSQQQAKDFSRRYKDAPGTLHAFVGYMAGPGDGERDGQVHILDGFLEGKVVSPAGCVDEPAWTRCFEPDGYKKTLAELKRQSFIVSPHNKPLVELAALLRSLAYEGCLAMENPNRGLFEVHITVRTPSEQDGGVPAFQAMCDKLGVKAVFIQNDTGETPRQLMTASYHSGTLQEVHVLCFKLSERFVRDGFEVSRVKIESTYSNRGIPETEDEAAALSPHNYFEFHWKLVLPPDYDDEELRRVCKTHSVHLSRNAFRTTAEGSQHRFVTMRLYHCGKIKAGGKLQAVTQALKDAGFNVSKTLREYAVYDSNVKLDSGWVETAGARREESRSEGGDAAGSPQAEHERRLQGTPGAANKTLPKFIWKPSAGK